MKRSGPSVLSQILSKSAQRRDAHFWRSTANVLPPEQEKGKGLPPGTLIQPACPTKSLRGDTHAKKVRPQKPFAIVQNGRHYALSEKWGTAILCGSRKNGEKSHWPGLRQIDSSIDFPCTAAVHRSPLWLHWPISEKKNSGLLWIKPKCRKKNTVFCGTNKQKDETQPTIRQGKRLCQFRSALHPGRGGNNLKTCKDSNPHWKHHCEGAQLFYIWILHTCFCHNHLHILFFESIYVPFFAIVNYRDLEVKWLETF